jgi:diguanylate cyclase (GGDEF)-like protein
MYKGFRSIRGGVFGAAAQFLRISNGMDHETLSRCILGISKMRDLDGIFKQTSACLRELNCRLFAVVLQGGDDFHIWSVKNHCNADLYQKVRSDFSPSIQPVTHPLECDMDAFCSLEDLRSFTLTNDAYSTRVYWVAHEKPSRRQRQFLDLIIRTMEIAVSNALEMEKLRKEAAFDRLTNTYSRREFDRLIEHSIANAQRHKRSLSVIMLDIDHFKKVNDNHGHLAGDAVLREVAKTLSGSIRKGDYIARYGGEEFIVILPETKMIRAIELAERLRRAIEVRGIAVPGGETLKITASFGVSSLKPGFDRESLIKEADEMMYRAKTHGRNMVMPGVKLHGEGNYTETRRIIEDAAMSATLQRMPEQLAVHTREV